MFVGYAIKYGTDMHKMWNLKTEKILVTCDIIWL